MIIYNYTKCFELSIASDRKTVFKTLVSIMTLPFPTLWQALEAFSVELQNSMPRFGIGNLVGIEHTTVAFTVARLRPCDTTASTAYIMAKILKVIFDPSFHKA